MARKSTTVIDATNVTSDARAPLIAAAKRHGMRTIAVLVSTPASVCVERQGTRRANRSVPEDTVHQQHKAMVRSHPALLSEGFNEVLFADASTGWSRSSSACPTPAKPTSGGTAATAWAICSWSAGTPGQRSCRCGDGGPAPTW